MRIGFDVSQTGECKAGCGFFAHSLIQHLEAEDRQNEYILYSTFGDTFWDPTWSSGTFRTMSPKFRQGLSHGSLDEAQKFWRNPPEEIESLLGEPDIIHANNFFCPLGIKKARLIYTLYDLAFIDNPEWTTEENRIACFNGVFRASLYADEIISISEHTREHFLEIFPHYPADRVKVVYPASRFDLCAAEARPPDSVLPLMPGEFWLHVGTVEPRKNQRKLLSAYAQYKTRQTRAFPLVLAGGRGWLMADFEPELQDLNLQGDVITLGYVDDSVLRWLYENCLAFIYPSLFEGFGLPVVEAMSFGVPVIASNRSALPEIVGNAGVLVDPCDSGEIAAAMVELARNAESRIQLGVRARERASSFSWTRTARKVLDIYSELKQRPKKGELK